MECFHTGQIHLQPGDVLMAHRNAIHAESNLSPEPSLS
jgi:hypothetical protein